MLNSPDIKILYDEEFSGPRFDFRLFWLWSFRLGIVLHIWVEFSWLVFEESDNIDLG